MTLHNILVESHHIGSSLLYERIDLDRNWGYADAYLRKFADKALIYYVKSSIYYTKLMC